MNRAYLDLMFVYRGIGLLVSCASLRWVFLRKYYTTLACRCARVLVYRSPRAWLKKVDRTMQLYQRKQVLMTKTDIGDYPCKTYSVVHFFTHDSPVIFCDKHYVCLFSPSWFEIRCYKCSLKSFIPTHTRR